MKQKSHEKLQLNIVFRAEPEGGFTALVPTLPGCVTYGKDLKEAERMAKEAIILYIEDLAAEGEAIPQDTQTYLSNIEVALPSSLRSRTYA